MPTTVVLAILMYAAGLLLLAGGIAALVSMHIARRSAAPFFPSSKRILRQAMQEAALAPGETFYDPGAGTGTSLVIASNEFGARAYGSEINLLPYCIARVNILFHRSRANISFKSLFLQDFGDADVVFCFLSSDTMGKLEPKFLRELKPGARIVCHAFPLPTLPPEKTVSIPGAWKIFLYRMPANRTESG